MGRCIEFSWAVMIAGLLMVHPAAAGGEEPGSRLAVAKVNGKVLYMDQLEPIIRVQQKSKPHRGTAKLETEKVAQRRALEQLIDVELLSQQARELKVTNLEEKVNKRMAGLRHTQPTIFAEKSEAEIRELLVEEFCVEAYLQEQGVADPEIPEAEIRALYDKGQESFRTEEAVRLRHISIQLPVDATADGKSAAREILQRARQQTLAGIAFETTAEEALREPGGAQGELGLLTRRDMPEEIASAAFALPPGSTSQIIETPSGVHLVAVLERQPARIAPYEELRDFLRKYLQEGRRRQAYQNLVQGLRRQAEIEILPGPG